MYRRLLIVFVAVVSLTQALIVPQPSSSSSSSTCTREQVLQKTAGAIVLSIPAWIGSPSISSARGRATLKESYDRYVPRIVTGGEFYSKDLKAIIAKNDWEGLKAATAEPPKRTKEDKAKPDGGIAERAAKAGGFSDARVLTACDLFAAGFSDNSISAKTKAMKAEVDVMRNVIEEMNLSARIALGETKPEGGLFGMGGKKPSVQELAQNVRKLYIDGGNAYNKYVYEANEALPVTIDRMPYL